MRAYKAVPNSWYAWMLGVNFAAAGMTCLPPDLAVHQCAYASGRESDADDAVLLVLWAPLQTPVWALVLSVIIATVFLVPYVSSLAHVLKPTQRDADVECRSDCRGLKHPDRSGEWCICFGRNSETVNRR
jgi:hypothetical protein